MSEQQKVEKNKVVRIKYELYDIQTGEKLEESEYSYIHGTGAMLPALEKALEGLKVGDEKEVELEAKDAYGIYREDLVDRVPLNAFGGQTPQKGMVYYAQTPEGEVLPFTVKDIQGNEVVVDFNHPLAGRDLKFRVKVVEVRDATPEELEHGHVHEDGHGHHHH